MPNELILIFKKDDIVSLIETNPDKIVVRSYIEEATLDNGEKVGVVRVYADAMRNEEPEPLATIVGCPSPPCN